MGSRNKTISNTILGISVSLVIVSCTSEHSGESDSTVPSKQSIHSSNSAVIEEDMYRNGIYEAIGQYGSLPSSITVTVTLVDDVITKVEVTPHATNPTSLDLQQRFAEAVPEVVVGKRIDEVKVNKLAGSSGTPNGFNQAIEKIKKQSLDSTKG